MSRSVMSADLSDWLSCYIKLIDFEFWPSHSLAAQHAGAVLHRSVVIISFMNDIQFQFKNHQLMLLSQQWDKMQDNLIYETEDFWGNLHAADSESETSLKLLCKWDLVISRSCDPEILWLTVMWPGPWHNSKNTNEDIENRHTNECIKLLWKQWMQLTCR